MQRLFLSTLLCMLCWCASYAQKQPPVEYYLLCHESQYSKGPALALSNDGIHFHELICGYPVVLPNQLKMITHGLMVNRHIDNVYDISPMKLKEIAVARSYRKISEAEYKQLQAWSDAEEHKYLAKDVKNPVFKGLHADPDIIYSNLTHQYYIYPTTDGSYGWHSHDFRCFSSPDLKTWKDEGVILDLHNLSWGKEYAWAPCAIEKPIMQDGKVSGYKYYYYFVANKSIGVAVADNPAGPFRDALDGPLLTQDMIQSPNIVIDPDVFQDPQTGKFYLYWGNSYLWMAELADDMVSFVPGTMHELIPRSRIGEYNYLEAPYVFERKGLYYFMWSENITRSAKYRIRYLISDSPTELVRNGKPAKVEDNIVLQMDATKQIFGTGHNSVINIPGTDEWHIVYHRFTRPEGIKMGLSGGYNREICIDRMHFNPDGTIQPVSPQL